MIWRFYLGRPDSSRCRARPVLGLTIEIDVERMIAGQPSGHQPRMAGLHHREPDIAAADLASGNGSLISISIEHPAKNVPALSQFDHRLSRRCPAIPAFALDRPVLPDFAGVDGTDPDPLTIEADRVAIDNLRDGFDRRKVRDARRLHPGACNHQTDDRNGEQHQISPDHAGTAIFFSTRA